MPTLAERPELLETALQLAERGIPVQPGHHVNGEACSCGKWPCGSPGKHPRTGDDGKVVPFTTDPKAIAAYWREWPWASVRIQTGPESGLLLLDVDRHNGQDGFARLAELEAEHGKLPETWTETTPGGGSHRYFRLSGETAARQAKPADGLEIHYGANAATAAPSLGPNGTRYEWVEGASPFDIEAAPAPEWFVSVLTAGRPAAQVRAAPLPTGEPIPVGQRGKTLIRAAKALHLAGYSDEQTRSAVQPIVARFEAPRGDAWSEKDVERALASAKKYAAGMGAGEELKRENGNPAGTTATAATHAAPPTKRPAKSDGRWLAEYENPKPQPQNSASNKRHLTDDGNALRLVDACSDRVRHAGPRGVLVWNGKYWERDEGKEMLRLARVTARSIYDEVAKESDPDRQKALAKWAITSQSGPRIEAMVRLALSDERIQAKPDDFDRNPLLFNVQNGTIDLRTGELRAHDPDDLITKFSPARHDEHATARRWTRFLREITCGDDNLADYLRLASGMCLTGLTRDHVFLELWGGGENGKSTFLEAIHYTMGSYAVKGEPDLLMETRGGRGGPRSGIAQLQGARLCTVIETGEGKRLNEPVVKWLSGGDRLRGSFLYSDSFEFQPTHKLWLATNHKPRVTGTDDGIWRRIRLIPFRATFPEGKADPDLPLTLQAESSGILMWMRAGAMEYLGGTKLTAPDVVVQATASYRADEDHLGEFLSECCILGDGGAVGSGELQRAYLAWCSARGETPGSSTAMAERLESSGCSRSRTNKARGWAGIALIAPSIPATREGSRERDRGY
jgi:putative DNA primase/helicase